ncbi:hypothetical protein [Streptomyces sp. NPDC016845]|uniref:hypothetical protein n=1 Tax=Streptomyces sp. NPDC016845 TaxID=3364972 RepID=UPI0037BB7FA0
MPTGGTARAGLRLARVDAGFAFAQDGTAEDASGARRLLGRTTERYWLSASV